MIERIAVMSPTLREIVGNVALDQAYQSALSNGLFAYHMKSHSQWNVTCHSVDMDSNRPSDSALKDFLAGKADLLVSENFILLKEKMMYDLIAALPITFNESLEEVEMLAEIEVFDLWENNEARFRDPYDLDPIIDKMIQEGLLCYRLDFLIL